MKNRQFSLWRRKRAEGATWERVEGCCPLNYAAALERYGYRIDAGNRAFQNGKSDWMFELRPVADNGGI